MDGVFDAGTIDKWFNPYHSDSRAKYIQDTIDHCEIMLYGRVTYEMMYPYWSALKNNEMGVAEKLNKVKKYIVSSTLKKADWENSAIINQNSSKEISLLKQEEGGDILVQGSATLVKSLLKDGLVDELKLLINPYIAGTGRRFFSDEINKEIEFNNFQQLEKGVIALSYKQKE